MQSRLGGQIQVWAPWSHRKSQSSDLPMLAGSSWQIRAPQSGGALSSQETPRGARLRKSAHEVTTQEREASASHTGATCLKRGHMDTHDFTDGSSPKQEYTRTIMCVCTGVLYTHVCPIHRPSHPYPCLTYRVCTQAFG